MAVQPLRSGIVFDEAANAATLLSLCEESRPFDSRDIANGVYTGV
jgi:hypothetical protein